MARREDMSEQTVIQVRGVSKVFQTEEVRTHALADVNLSIGRGEYVAISGPSGCGKSTLMSILGLLDTPTSGEYELNGQPVAKLTPKERARARNRQIGFIFQSFNLLGDMTVAENVALPLAYRGMSTAEQKAHVDRALERVGMTERARPYPPHPAAGQQQRVAVARAVAGEPAILLAGEPTGNLASRNGEAVMRLIAALHRSGAKVWVVTHDARFAEHATRVVHVL